MWAVSSPFLIWSIYQAFAAFSGIRRDADSLGSIVGMAGLGIALAFYINTTRFVVRGGALSEYRFGFKLWSLPIEKIEVRQTNDELPYWYIHNRQSGRTVGKIYCVQFYPADLELLLSTLFPHATIEDE